RDAGAAPSSNWCGRSSLYSARKRLNFDHQLDMLDPASSIGFPWSLDPEWVTVVPRALRGHVVTRRELYQLRAQPPGYELSFHAPRGISGGPLVVHVRGSQ